MSCYTNLIFSLFLFYRFLSEEPSPYRGGEVCVPQRTYELCCLVPTPSCLPWQITPWRVARIRMVREDPWRMMKRRWGLSSIWRHWVKFTPSVKVSWKLPMDWPFPKAHDKFRRTFPSVFSKDKKHEANDVRCDNWRSRVSRCANWRALDSGCDISERRWADVTSHRGSELMLPLISLCVIYSNCFVLTIFFSDFVGPLAVCNVLLY